jgi:hypothetical protein
MFLFLENPEVEKEKNSCSLVWEGMVAFYFYLPICGFQLN